MKRNIYLAIIGLMFVILGCSHELEKSTLENYTPPSIKEQPKLFYPVSAQENSIYGNTKASLKITKEGTVEKVFIYKSSGSKILDNAVSEHCKKLKFNPAIKDGEPIESRILWEINFNFTNEAFSINEYLKGIDELYDLANRAIARERMEILHEAINKHLEFIKKNSDALNFNTVISQIINNRLASEWKNEWNSYPLSFLIFHDFITRFSDYDSISYVKAIMFNSVKNDLQYIQNYPVSPKQQVSRERLIQKIKKFISEKYPDQLLQANRKDQLLVKNTTL